MSKRVSILMPIYNATRWIECSVRSIFEQSEARSCEFIFVDDGSHDHSCRIVEELAREYSQDIKLVRLGQNMGVAEARNCALSMASGEYLLFVDSDDWIAPDTVRELLSRSADLISSDIYNVRGRKQKIERTQWRGGAKGSLRHILAQNFILPNRIWGVLIRRELIERGNIRFERGVDYGEDSLFLVKLLYYAGSVEHVASPLYYYRCDSEGSYSNTMSERNIRSYIRSQISAWRFIEAQRDAEQYKTALHIGRLNLQRWISMRRGGGGVGSLLFRIYCFVQRIPLLLLK